MGSLTGVVASKSVTEASKGALKPIKLEDRVAHIRKVMPEFDYMRTAFDIDVE